MALQARHRFIIARISDTFNVDEYLLEDLIKQEDVLARITSLLSPNGLERIIFAFFEAGAKDLPRLPTGGMGGVEEKEEKSADGDSAGPTIKDLTPYTMSGNPTLGYLLLTQGHDVSLPSRSIFFLKTNNNNNSLGIDPTISTDQTLSYGIINNPLRNLEVVMRNVYKPLLRNAEAGIWGASSASDKNEMLSCVDIFLRSLDSNLKSMNSGIELRKPDVGYEVFGDVSYNSNDVSVDVVNHYMELLEEWCVTIDAYLDDTDRTLYEHNDSGPDTELEFWRRRMQRLNSITEQLKGRKCRGVIGGLNGFAKSVSDSGNANAYGNGGGNGGGHGNNKRVITLVKQWKQIDLNITSASNEAKDNMKYLNTLERFLVPLYSGDPESIIEILPMLMGQVKMICTVARYFNTSERMTKLFMKITNQMVQSCKVHLNPDNNTTHEAIWKCNPDELLVKLESCLRLNEMYQEYYMVTKDKLMTIPKGKQFDYSPTQIFGKFDLFCRRVIKLIDMFSNISQFKALHNEKIEGMNVMVKQFERIIERLKSKGHDLLDFNSNKLDRDYVEFNVNIAELERNLQLFIDTSFESITSISQSLSLLKRYQSILQRDSLRQDLNAKFTVIFNNYGLELTSVQQSYDTHKHNPPYMRNMPPVSGNIMWSRNLLRRISEPMDNFNSHTSSSSSGGGTSVLNSKESKRIIKTYNKVARTLVAFEYLWYDAWVHAVDSAKSGLQATLIIRHPTTNKLFVNFDREILQLIREAKCMTRIGIAIPESAMSILAQEARFKVYYNELKHALDEHERVSSMIVPVIADLLKPHLQTIELKLRPGMITLTWTSMNIESYKSQIHASLQRLEELIRKITDILENRVEKNLKVIARMSLVKLPRDRSITLDDFVKMQEDNVNVTAEVLKAKNTEVETAVDDIVSIVRSFPLDPSVGKVSPAYVSVLRNHYNNLTYRALLNCTKSSLESIKKRVCSRGSGGATFLFVERPFFTVDVQLSVPSVRLSPSLEDVQRSINRTAKAVIGCSKIMYDWGQQGTPEEERKTLFDKLGCDVEIIKVVLLLTGALYGTRNQVHEYLQTFKKYDWLWKDDKELTYETFMKNNKNNPNIQSFQCELKNFMSIESEIDRISPLHIIGALSLNTANLKLQLMNESRQWKIQYSNKVHQQARESMSDLFEYIRVTLLKLDMQVDGLIDLRRIMTVLREIRERESSIEMEINPILDMYSMLEVYLPGGIVDSREIDQKSVIRKRWVELVNHAEVVTDRLAEVQAKYRMQLIGDVKEFRREAETFRKNFERNGPLQKGITPAAVMEKLDVTRDALLVRERKMEMYNAGEELFALRISTFSDITKTKKEVILLDMLYTLYVDAETKIEGYRDIPWKEVKGEMEGMMEVINAFDSRCKNLPKKLKELDAYDVIRDKITTLMELLPLVENLTKDNIKARHWIETIALTGVSFPYDSEAFTLSHILDSNIMTFRDAVEEICEGADKQLQIDMKLSDIKEIWSRRSFDFGSWQDRSCHVLLSSGVVIEELEDAQLQLQTLLSMRHITPFKSEIQGKLTELSNTADELELWVKVQVMWTGLESVFMGGDIAKQMPVEAKKFNKVDKDFIKIMQKAYETRNVVACCKNDMLRNTLPVLYAELEKCQKSLEGYLEQKRKQFPRFYFVSNPVLLMILSLGSDPVQMQPYYEKVFDSISQVVHDKNDKTVIKKIKSISGCDEEVVLLNAGVLAVGNIENWLGSLEDQMQKTMKSLCEVAAATCNGDLHQFVDASCGQLALLGVQFNWTAQCQSAMEKCKSSKGGMAENVKVQQNVLNELSSWCLQDLGSAMNRTKIETLVTIHVHQKDVFSDLFKLYKERKLQDANDFEWLKQARFYWNRKSEDRHGPSAAVISVCDTDFKYAWEYLGCKERLVITPLTDRCYITLTQALGMHLGGAPAGPAGTGKTETTKDLGRTLGFFVVITNCTDQQRYTDMAKIFKGLCQAGLWGCFDEFNRIELPVLSVVAQQVLSITNAKRTHSTTFTFPGDSQVVTLNPDVAYFITMNPGYAGRQELPENLKALFRGVTMMVPDREIIMKVKLCSVGYSRFVELARKFNVLYSLCEQQLSKQKHYDFGLRNILSVLRTAGATKRMNLTDVEDVLMLGTLRDMNLSKMVSQDIPLFLSLLSDLFPNVGAPKTGSNVEIDSAIAKVVTQNKLIQHPSWVLKVNQLYDTLKVRHGIMLVGPAASGKSSIINTLSDALATTTKTQHKRIKMNPKAIRPEEMFGETNKLTGEWHTGIFAAIWQKYNNRANTFNMWIIADGPVDAIWIENLNTVLDDNKILTLANGDRIPMTDNVKLLFEVEDLKNATPATVSRAGIIYVSASDLDWAPIAEAWLNTVDASSKDNLAALFVKYVGVCQGDSEVGHIFKFVARNCQQVMSLTRVAMITKCFQLISVMLKTAELSSSSSDRELELERLFLFALVWSVGGMFEQEDRAKFDEYLRTISQVMPTQVDEADTVFMYQINMETMEWETWVAPTWAYPDHSEELDFSSLLIPTVDSTRALYLMSCFQSLKLPILLAGGSGTSKTSTVEMFFDGLDRDKTLVKRVNFSFATTPSMFQSAIDGELDKRGGKNFGPPLGKRMMVFLDDMSMPQVNAWGDQPTNELVRQLIETNGYYFLDKDKRGDFKIIEDLLFIGAMNHPTGGKNDIPNRLKRYLFAFNMTVPPVVTILNIYGQMMNGRFPAASHAGNFAMYVSKIPSLTIELWKWVRAKMLPSPAKFMYVWNMRELSRVFQGILRTPKSSLPDEQVLAQLWRHECARVFEDKLANSVDKVVFKKELKRLTALLLSELGGEIPQASLSSKNRKGGGGTSSKPGTADKGRRGSQGGGDDSPAGSVAGSAVSKPRSLSKQNTMRRNSRVQNGLGDFSREPDDEALTKAEALANANFVDFLRDDYYDEDGILTFAAPKVYEMSSSMESLTSRANSFLNKFNEEMPGKRMNLILFEDAMRHLMRVSRVIGTPRGNLLFVGVGGSGKQSLACLAAFIAGYHTFQVVLTKSYNVAALLDDLRILYKIAGQQGKGVMFLMTDAEVKDENFLEIINSVLMTGEIANLFPKDEMQVISAELRAIAVKEKPDFVDTPENLVNFFIDRVRANLHIVLAFSPVNPKLPERARKFPGLINGCSIDMFLEWPKEALIAVSKGFIGKVKIDTDDATKAQLIEHVGTVHNSVVATCEEYFHKMRRHLSQTPKSYLSFLNSYAEMYTKKLEDIENMSSRVTVGLEKLSQGADDVETMKVVLADEEVKLRKAEDAANVMLSKLELSSMAAKKKADAVTVIKSSCEADKERIAGEKALAEEDLAKAQPFVDEAERAVNSIKPNDLNELKKLGKPGDIIKLIFDVVALLKMEKVEKITLAEVTLGIGKEKQTVPFFRDSFKIQQTGMLSDSKFLNGIFYFSKYEKDYINDETIEFMLPYLELQGFDPLVARNASKAAEGLCTWSRAMSLYHGASKIVKPKLEALSLAEARLNDAQRDLDKAERKLQACEDVLANLQLDFENQMAVKRAIEENAAKTRKKMEQATSLIDGLAGERQRWTDDSHKFDDTRKRLVGDVGMACAFISYCGAFNQTFRDYIIKDKIMKDLKDRNIPVSSNLQLTEFLVDAGIVGDWSLEGLPSDTLSIQNGILVTRSTRFPLLIDPQGQALAWIKLHERDRLPGFGVTTFSSSRLREQLEYCMCEGKALIISGVENELDSMLTPVLEKQIITKGKSKYISISDKLCEYNDDFMLYMTTRLPNPRFSPEDQAKTTVVDFTVTQKGLEEQLLGRVIAKEQKSLEEQLKLVMSDVTSNTKSLLKLDQLLLERLSANDGNLLDDDELIRVLANTKAKATEVNSKLIAAGEAKISISEKREQYRPVATRGSVLYFSIVDISVVNIMYQTSLDQFSGMFDKSMDNAEKAFLASKRVGNIIDEQTYSIWRYIDRGLYSRDKASFKLLLLLKMLTTSGRIKPSDVTFFLKGGAGLDINNVRGKAFAWMSDSSWLNVVQLSMDKPMFKNMLELLTREEEGWKAWYGSNEPESVPIPGYETQINADKETGPFLRLLIVRCLREDRSLLAANQFIRSMEQVDSQPAMGERYIKPVLDSIESTFLAMDATTPIIFLLSAGADPTDGIEQLAKKKKKKKIDCVSMGEGQDVVAMRAINGAIVNGSWVMLQNAHLGLDFLYGLEELLNKITAAATCNEDFRLFITSEPHNLFPIGLLQMCTKITTEPPNGLKAGLLRSYTVMVDQDKLERIETVQWRTLLFGVCFLHSIVQERRKFGPLGWCVPYEYNDGDLSACLLFLEKHLYAGRLSWPTLQYMVSEAQYGGKITDEMDRRLFAAYTEAWLSPSTLSSGFSFNPKMANGFVYGIPNCLDDSEYHTHIRSFPNVDSPEIFGLHPNADLTFRNKEVNQLLSTMLETQPKAGGEGGGGGNSREDIVSEKCKDLLESSPAMYAFDDYMEKIGSMGGLSIPLNIFLMQEVQRLQLVIARTRSVMVGMQHAIRGEVVTTNEIMDGIKSIFDARVPNSWVFSAGGDEISWISPTLGLWFSGLIDRDKQIRSWLDYKKRPSSFWLTGFFNAQGFLTAVQQEVTRAHKADKWSLDSVEIHTEVTEYDIPEQIARPPKEGVYVYGLFLEGAAWSKAEISLIESQPKKLFCNLPILFCTAVTKAQKRGMEGDFGVGGGFECAVYKYPSRTDRFYIFSVCLATRVEKPAHWVLRGVALLCSTD